MSVFSVQLLQRESPPGCQTCWTGCTDPVPPSPPGWAGRSSVQCCVARLLSSPSAATASLPNPSPSPATDPVRDDPVLTAPPETGPCCQRRCRWSARPRAVTRQSVFWFVLLWSCCSPRSSLMHSPRRSYLRRGNAPVLAQCRAPDLGRHRGLPLQKL